MEKESCYIFSIEAQALYESQPETYQNKDGFNIQVDEKTFFSGKNYALLDYSLDAIELKRAYEKEFRKQKGFINKCEGLEGIEYTTTIINVKFNRAHNDYNKKGWFYVKEGYNLSDLIFEDNVCVQDGVLVGIRVDYPTKNPVGQEILGKYFGFKDGKYCVNKKPIVIKSKIELRKHLYENGFICNGHRYVRYKRSSGSSREGHCLFIMEELYNRMDKWGRCGLAYERTKTAKDVSWEAYISLTLSGIEKVINLNPEHILVLKDKQSIFEENVLAVEKKEDVLSCTEKKVLIKNAIWDGEALMDKSVFCEYGYEDKGMLLLRGKFFKTCAFNTNLQQWFEDNGITSIEQLNGDTQATKIEDIKLVVTESSIKYLKFGKLSDWRINVGNEFGVVKTDKKTGYFDGKMVRTNYQFINTIKMGDESASMLLKDSLNYINDIKNDVDVFRQHLRHPFNIDENFNGELDALCDEEDLASNFEIMSELLDKSENFEQTDLYKTFVEATLSSLKDKLYNGKVLISGTYATLLGNGYELLEETIGLLGEEITIKSGLQKGQIVSTFFPENTNIVGARSPHITMGNLLLCENVKNEKIEKYFNLTPEIVYVNAIEENLQQKLNGCDYDSDTMLLTDDVMLAKSVAKNYDRFLVPTYLSDVNGDDAVEKELYEIDYAIQNNKIGEIVNLSQKLNSLYWDDDVTKEAIDEFSTEQEELYKDICKLAVLSGLEIDKAKRESGVDVEKVIKDLTSKYSAWAMGGAYPNFFKKVGIKKIGKGAEFKFFETSMDHICSIVEGFRAKRKKNTKIIPLYQIIGKPDEKYKAGYVNDYVEKILDRALKVYNRCLALEINEIPGRANIKRGLKENCLKEIQNYLKNEYVVYRLLKKLEDDKESYNKCRVLLLWLLYNDSNKTFMRLLKPRTESLAKIVSCSEEEADLRLYKFHYKKQK